MAAPIRKTLPVWVQLEIADDPSRQTSMVQVRKAAAHDMPRAPLACLTLVRSCTLQTLWVERELARADKPSRQALAEQVRCTALGLST